MLEKSLASPLLTFEAAACCCFSSADFSTSKQNVALCSWNPSCATRERSVRASRKWRFHSTNQTQVAVLSEDEEKKTWEQCKQLLTTFNFTIDEADVMLRKAFGWSHSPYWGEERRKEVPENNVVNEMLDYLKSLSLSEEDLLKFLKKFPEVLGCDLDEEVKSNVGTLEREWGIRGKALRNLLLRNPKVLGYNVDCKGDCMAKCTRCWVRF